VSIALCSITTTMFGQSGVTGESSAPASSFPRSPTILPPSPDAFAFTRYGNLPVGLFTGTAQFSLPLYTVDAGSLKHNIGISYSSNGVKVDEMASRLGINWVLQAGGVITRTVMDKPDDAPGIVRNFYQGPTVQYFGGFASFNWTFYDYVRKAVINNAQDFQPDEYSFSMDGLSGKFIQRQNGQFKLLTSSSIRIEKNTQGFLLTSGDGVRYYFTLTETARGYSYPESSLFEWQPAHMPTAWYLTKIVSPNRDSIVFNYASVSNGIHPVVYDNGITQDYSTKADPHYYLNTTNIMDGDRGFAAPEQPIMGLASIPAGPGLVTTVQRTDNYARYLTSIEFKLGRVELVYSDREDVLFEKKLDTVKVIRNGDNQLIKSFAFNHTYSNAAAGGFDTYIIGDSNYTASHPEIRKRLFLTGVAEQAVGLATAQNYIFEYEDMNGLPPRLSFSQDRYGYFNGKQNTYFFPNDTWFDQFIGDNDFGGDRTASLSHSKKGILKKIVYPTGGYTLLEYGPNQTFLPYAYRYIRDSVTALLDTSTYNGHQALSDTFHHDGNRELRFKGSCSWATFPVGGSSGGDTSLGNYGIYIEIVDANNNICAGNCNYFIRPGDSFSYGDYLYKLPLGIYRIRLTATVAGLRSSIKFITSLKENLHNDTTIVAGIRVKSIADFAENGKETNRREYHYGAWGSPNASSGKGLRYSKDNKLELSFTRGLFSSLEGTSISPGNTAYGGFNTIHSNSVLTNFITDANAVVYDTLIEMNITSGGMNNGGIEYNYHFQEKDSARPVRPNWGKDVWDAAPYVPPGAPMVNNDFLSGQLRSQKVFSFQQKHGTRNMLEVTDNYYKVDSGSLQVDTFTVSKKVIDITSVNPEWPYFYYFDIYRYLRYYGWVRLDSTVKTRYDGTEAIRTRSHYFAYSTKHYKPRSIFYTVSTGPDKSLSMRYVGDMLPLDPGYSTVYEPMMTANRVNGIVQETNDKDFDQLSKKRLVYAYFPGIDLYLPSQSFSSLYQNSEVLDITYDQYDANGNLLQYTGRDGIVHSIIWGYNRSYPVAVITGASYSAAIALLNTATINNPPSDAALRTELNNLRTGLPVTAMIKSFTYSPLIGITSQTDERGQTTYFSYDHFNRLHLVRDHENNILKRFCYKYNGQAADCDGLVYENKALNQPFTKNNCSSGYGTVVNYLVPPGKYTSSVSQAAADAQAQAEATANGQANANAFGICEPCNSNNCTGVDKKCINGICETGTKICSSIVKVGGVWITTYHYQWSDNSVSPDYQEIGIGCLVL
ncbi:MAG TPA: DUF5977 domain-containing protein, partial [Flavisolibacter sp.]|nr:DUF5977 domain-containing protein [Flavisolibacter sp.]